MSCSTSTIALTPARFAAAIKVLMMPCLSDVDTPEVGSSSRITCGSSAKAEATSSSFFSPCERRRRDSIEPRPEPEDIGDLATRASIPASAERRAKKRQRFFCRDTTAAAMVSAHRQLGENLDQLKGAREAMIGQRNRSDARDVLAHEEHLACSRLQQPGEHIDERRLAGAVRSDDRHELALVHRHRDLIERTNSP